MPCAALRSACSQSLGYGGGTNLDQILPQTTTNNSNHNCSNTKEVIMDSSDSEDELKVALILLLRRNNLKRKNRSMWVRPIFKRRKQQGEYHNLLQEMRLSDPDCHFMYLRMSKERFDLLLSQVGPKLSHKHYYSAVRPEISPAERLAVTIRFLATGNSQVSLSFNFRMGRSTVCTILSETCSAIWDVLMEQYVKAPSTEAEWNGISRHFQQMWNFPHCLGAIDGKHIVMQAPVNSLSFPKPCPLPGTTEPELPFAFVADEAFPLRTNMMRPYPGKNVPEKEAIFNYRLSRARRIIENAFGILAARWRIFRRPIISEPCKVVIYTKAAIALHNYLRTTESAVYCPAGFVDGEDGTGSLISGSWRSDDDPVSGMNPLRQAGGNRYSRNASDVRDAFRDYYNTSTGEVSWQYTYVRRT